MTGRREGLLKQTARIPGAACCRSPSERAVGAGRGRPAATGRRDGLLKQTAQIPGADCCRSPSERAVGAGRGRPAGVGQHSHGQMGRPRGPGHMGRPNDMVHYGMQLSYMVLEQIGLYQG